MKIGEEGQCPECDGSLQGDSGPETAAPVRVYYVTCVECGWRGTEWYAETFSGHFSEDSAEQVSRARRRPPGSPVGVINVGYEITAAVRMHSVGVCSDTSEDYWVVLGHNPAKSEMVCWHCRWQENYGWAFSHGTYVSGVRESFMARIGDELPRMVNRTESRSQQRFMETKRVEASEDE